MKYFIGIDPGTKLGWAVLDENGSRINSGTYQLTTNDSFKGKRYRIAFEFFEELIRETDLKGPTYIGFEHVRRWASSDAALVYNGILAALYMAADDFRIPYTGFAPTSIKKLWTGTGKATKAEMIMAANEMFQIKVKDDNEADALLIAKSILAKHVTTPI